jgi:plasmid stabilization system protein ParE
MYSIEYLLSAEDDFLKIVRYIAINLSNPKAAGDFADLYEEKVAEQ